MEESRVAGQRGDGGKNRLQRLRFRGLVPLRNKILRRGKKGYALRPLRGLSMRKNPRGFYKNRSLCRGLQADLLICGVRDSEKSIFL